MRIRPLGWLTLGVTLLLLVLAGCSRDPGSTTDSVSDQSIEPINEPDESTVVGSVSNRGRARAVREAKTSYGVAVSFPDPGALRLLGDPGIVRHRGKIESTLCVSDHAARASDDERRIIRLWIAFVEQCTGSSGQISACRKSHHADLLWINIPLARVMAHHTDRALHIRN